MKARIIKLDRQPHPNANKLFIQAVGDGKVVCGRIEDWEGKTHAVYIPPGAIVDTDLPQFAWLKSGDERYHTVQARQMRGTESYGLMVEAPEGHSEGEDMTERLQVKY
jgi:tRNA-binding EMAP/Myf-like protein